jgi:C_GCAxxG_C_C family probable redox protein
MGDDSFRLTELALQGFDCSQVLMMRALEALGEENPALVRAVSGLHRGLASGEVCGALSGGCCVLALHAGRGTADETEAPDLDPLLQELVEWFEGEYSARYGGIDCRHILDADPRNQVRRCPQVISAVAAKVDELLARRQTDGSA